MIRAIVDQVVCYRWFLGVTLLVVALNFVPIWPHYPACNDHPTGYHPKKITEPMGDDYRVMLKDSFRRWGIVYWDIGDRLFIPYLPNYFNAFSPHAYVDRGGIIETLEYSAAKILTFSKDTHGEDGLYLDGRLYHPPEWLASRNLDYFLNRSDAYRCDVMYYIVTGTEPPGWREKLQDKH